MQADEIVDLLADSEGEAIKVTDVEGNSWRAVVDDVDIVPLSSSRNDPDGDLLVVTAVPDKWWDECPSEVYSPSIISSEDSGEWDRPRAHYDSDDGDDWSVDVESVEVLEDD